MMDPKVSIDQETLRDGELELKFREFASHPVHKSPTYYFQMVHSVSGAELGNINLRVGCTAHIEQYAGHVGFTVDLSHRGHRFAARSLRLLLPLAYSLRLNPLWITCDPENIASRRSLEIASAEFIEVVSVPADCVIHQSGHLHKCRYKLTVPEPENMNWP